MAGIVAASLAASATVCAADETTLRFRLGEDPETLYNVQSISLTVSQVLGTYLLDRLVYLDGEGQPAPWLAESWEVSDDQRVVTFTLVEGILFHDGTPLDAEAVKFHFDAVRDPANASPLLPLIGPLEAVEVLDPRRVRFSFSEPYAPFFNILAQGQFGINSPTAVQEHGNLYGRNPVGTGPYRLASWLPGTEIVLERNPDYRQLRSDAVNQGAPHAERIVLSVISEDGVALAALETGELTSAALQADSIDRFVDDPAFNLVIDRNVRNLVFLEFNQRRAPFDDPAFRRAIAHAIDREAAVQAAWSGYAAPALGPLATGIPGYDAAVSEAYGAHFDPALAQELLTELGWTAASGNGVLAKDGQEARFLVRSYSGFVHIERTLAVIQSNLADIGIRADLELSDWGAFYPSLLANDWDMDLMRWTWNDPNVLTSLFRSPGHREALLADPAIDEVLDRCDQLADPVVRADCVSEAQKLLLEATTIVPILSNWNVIASQANVRDYTLDFLGNLIPGDVWIEN